MSRDLFRRTLLLPLVLATLAGCTNTDTTAPTIASNPAFAQGENGVWTVNSLADPGDGVCDDPNCTLREAITAAASGDQVAFASSLQGTIALTFGRIEIMKPLSVNGGGRITLDALGNDRVIFIANLAPTAMIVTLDGLTLENGSSFASGGAVFIRDVTAVTIRNSTISGSTAINDGGGVFISQTASVTLINSTVDGNTATGDGGGIYNAGSLVINGSTVASNTAFDGAGIYSSGSATVSRTTVSGNNATVTGGIRSVGTTQVISSTVTGNTSGITNGSPTFRPTIVNSIVAGNGQLNCDGALTSLGYNLTVTATGCPFSGSGDVQVSASQVFTSVLEQTLKDNGGPTKTHALIARGLAVDAGYCPGETADQRGFARPVDDPTRPDVQDACDIGAYEAQGPVIAVADLMISQAVNKTSVKQGELLTYTIRVQNLGPQTAPNVAVNNLLSSGVTFFEARQNRGSITAPPRGETGTVTWNVGDMVNQANEVAEIVVTVLVRGKTTITNTASVTGSVADPNTANNSAAITVSVAPGSSGKKP